MCLTTVHSRNLRYLRVQLVSVQQFSTLTNRGVRPRTAVFVVVKSERTKLGSLMHADRMINSKANVAWALASNYTSIGATCHSGKRRKYGHASTRS